MDEVVVTPYRARRAKARAERRTRALERIPAASRVDVARVADPLSRSTRQVAIPVWITASVAAHLGIAALGALVPPSTKENPAFEQAVEMVEAPKPAPPPVTAAATEPPPVAEPVIARPTKAPTNIPPPTKDEPPPDPIQAVASPDPAPARPARRIVGLNLDSTVNGASGQSFAIGNTRMGETARTAGDPANAAPLPGAQFVPPRRLHEVQPDYPPALRAQNIEGEVGLEVDVDATGHVSDVTVIAASPQAAFNSAAIAAAKASTYQPALMNATPVANTIQFTVRFRLKH